MIDLMKLDEALANQNAGSFVSFDTDTVFKIRNNTYVRKITTGIVSNVSTDYRKRVLAENPEYVFTPKPYLVRVEGSKNLMQHVSKGTKYFSMPFKIESGLKRPDVKIMLGESEEGPWKEISYDEYQEILPASKRDGYRKADAKEKGRALEYRLYKAESITAFRTGGETYGKAKIQVANVMTTTEKSEVTTTEDETA